MNFWKVMYFPKVILFIINNLISIRDEQSKDIYFYFFNFNRINGW